MAETEKLSITQLTQEHIDKLQTSKLNKDTPFAIMHVTQTMFSVARFYGGANYNGKYYTYLPDADQLVRDDVLKWLKNNNT